MNDHAEVIHEICRKRRSIRNFKTDPIPVETIDSIMQSACWAPSAMNRQPWKFFILTDEMRDRLASIHEPVFKQNEEKFRERYGDEGAEKRRRLYLNLGGAPVAVVCFTEKKADTLSQDRISAALACENLVLAAFGEGIGSLIMTSSAAIKDEISFLCGVDTQKFDFMMVILLGYANEDPEAPERRKSRIVKASTPADIRNAR
ncbi:MAG: nitroreductase family protein [bacterium]